MPNSESLSQIETKNTLLTSGKEKQNLKADKIIPEQDVDGADSH